MSIKAEARAFLFTGAAVASAFELVAGFTHHAAPVDATAPGGRVSNHWIAYPRIHDGPSNAPILPRPKIRVGKH